MSADFNWFINRQGPRGMQGIQGVQGFSPVITVAEDTPAAYILRIQTQDDTFLTSNLRGSVEDLGGTYVRYNRETGSMYAGPADVASTTQSGIVRMASEQDISELSQEAVVTPFNVSNMITDSPIIGELNTKVSENSANITKNTQNITTIENRISGIENNYVTIDTMQTITGFKTFNYLAEFNDGIRVTTVDCIDSSSTTRALEYNGTDRFLIIGSKGNPNVAIYGNIYNRDIYDNQYKVLTEKDIATVNKAGIIKPDGTSITIDADGTIHGASTYTLPTASATVLGGVKVGEGLEISEDGTLKATAPTIDTTNLAKLNERNEFSQYNLFNGGLFANGQASFGQPTNGIMLTSSDAEGFIEAYGGVRKIEIKPSVVAHQSKLSIEDNALTFTNSDGVVTDLLAQQPTGSVNDKYGIRGDYSTHFGIIDCPNGLINYSATDKDITLQAGVILKAAGNNNIKTTIASPITYTVTSTGEATLFYAGGEIIEATKVSYQTEQPEDNGTDAFQAWYNPELGKWQFKSNATGNVWREAIATPIANINSTAEGLTRVDYIGYRVLDDDILVTKQVLAPYLETINTLQQAVAQLEARVTALETEINGGGADGSPNVEVRGIVESFKNNSTPVGDTLGNITETYRNEVS